MTFGYRFDDVGTKLFVLLVERFGVWGAVFAVGFYSAWVSTEEYIADKKEEKRLIKEALSKYYTE